jgi:hypothetical protein
MWAPWAIVLREVLILGIMSSSVCGQKGLFLPLFLSFAPGLATEKVGYFKIVEICQKTQKAVFGTFGAYILGAPGMVGFQF